LSESFLPYMPLRTQCATVRRLIATDLAAFRTYRADPELARFQSWSPMNESEAASFIAEMTDIESLIPDQWIQLGIAHASNDQLLGDIGVYLSRDEMSAEIGFTLSKNAQGRGIATDVVRATLQLVFAVAPVRVVRAITDARNHPSIRLLERLHFVFLSEAAVEFKGEWCIEQTYELSRERMESR
jgi:RimJ/RimL family protein N-acetyltransferase